MKLRHVFVLIVSLFIFASCSEPIETEVENPGDTQNPSDNTQNPSDNTQNPSDNTQNPGDNTQNPGNSSQNPGDNTQNPGDNTQNPGNNTQNPDTDLHAPIPETTSSCKPNPHPQYPNLITDEDWARALISGAVPAETAFSAIAYSCGFPVLTDDDTVLFIHWYKGESWSVAGDLNDWNQQVMQASSNGEIQSAELKMPTDSSKNKYKFVKNNADWLPDPWSLRYGYDDNGEFSYIKAPENQQYMMRWHMFESPQGLKTRTIYALVPPNKGPYDVLYSHDGQNLFAPDALGGGWKLRENMTSINGNFLIVGIPNTEDRFREYTHVDDTIDYGGTMLVKSLGDAYAKFVEESVRPFIESKFQTTSKAGVMGSSLGGLISLYIAHLYPNRYRMVLALSPTTAWGRFGSDSGTTIKDLYLQAGHRSTYLYLDNGGNEPSGGCPAQLGQHAANSDESGTDNYCFTRDFVDNMVKLGYQYDVDLSHWHEPNAAHNEDAWAKRVFRPLKIFMDLK